MSFKVAIASNDGKRINEHFGKTLSFLIYEIKEDGSYKFLESRKNTPPYDKIEFSNLKDHDNLLERSINLILDCNTVLASQIGPKATHILYCHGIQSYMINNLIDEALRRLDSSKLKTRSSNQNAFKKIFKVAIN
jgi:predicted Fe-Mo cluster-binding NifX family protein